MRTTVVCGVLGAGKTTFIRHIAKNAKEKTVILVNDFGSLGIDGEIFSTDGIESIELPSGCVCCTLKFDLMTTLQKITEKIMPEHLIIEPSGVASASGVLEALDTLRISQVTVVGMIDASEFLELHGAEMYGAFFEDQIIHSDILVVNKTDLADEGLVNKTVQAVEALNPRAVVFCTVNAALSGPLPTVSRKRSAVKGLETRFHFDTISLSLRKGASFSSCRRLFEDMACGVYGTVVRAKALVETDQGPFRFDLSYNLVNNAPFGKTVARNRLVVIGEVLKRDDLAQSALKT